MVLVVMTIDVHAKDPVLVLFDRRCILCATCLSCFDLADDTMSHTGM